MTQLKEFDQQTFDPKINLDFEAKLASLYSKGDVLLRFWINSRCLVLGRFQRPEYEISHYARTEGVPFFHRLSGGGTVYHDVGNLNISIVAGKEQFKKLGNLSPSHYCSEMVADGLRSLGFVITHDPKRHALYIDGKKIMGSAASISGDCYHFHCSLLVSTDLLQLEKMIEQNPQYHEADRRFVASVRSPVTSLQRVCPTITMDQVQHAIRQQVIHSLCLSDDLKRA